MMCGLAGVMCVRLVADMLFSLAYHILAWYLRGNRGASCVHPPLGTGLASRAYTRPHAQQSTCTGTYTGCSHQTPTMPPALAQAATQRMHHSLNYW